MYCIIFIKYYKNINRVAKVAFLQNLYFLSVFTINNIFYDIYNNGISTALYCIKWFICYIKSK